MFASDNPLTKGSKAPGGNHIFFWALCFLLLVDAAFISLYVARDFLFDTSFGSILSSDLWLLEKDGGFPEIYQYVKTFVAAALLFGLFKARRNATYLAWFLALCFVLLDDVLQLHETFGNFLLANYQLPTIAGIDSYLYVEAILWAIIGLPLMALLIYGYFRDVSTRMLSRRITYLFIVLFLFAGIADGLHAFIARFGSSLPYVKGLTAILEDGGEMLALSLMTAYIIGYYVSATEPLRTRPPITTPIDSSL